MLKYSSHHSVGKLLVAALRHPTESNGQALKVNSFTTTPDEVLAEYEKQVGTKFDVQYVPLDELRELEQEAWEKHGLGATVFILRRIWTEGGTLYETRDNERIGVGEMETLGDVVKRAIEIQTR